MIGLFALAAASSVACPAENARYALRHAPDVTAYFRAVDGGPDWPGGLALAVRRGASGRTFWWLPWIGGADNLQNLASTTDVTAPDWRAPDPDGGPRPLGDRQYIGMDAEYDVIDDIPRRGRPAPHHILIPTAGSSRDEAFPAKRFFDLVGCTTGDR